jgi:hypothetical protein
MKRQKMEELQQVKEKRATIAVSESGATARTRVPQECQA